MAIVLASYNIQRGIGLDLRRDLDRALAILRQIEADVIAVQEVTRADGAPVLDQAGYLARALSMDLVRCEVRPDGARGDRTYGHAVLTRLPVLGSEECELSVDGREPRRALRVDVLADGRALHVFGCHLGLGIRERRVQVETLVRFVRATPAHAGWRVVTGDFNEWYVGPVARALEGELGGATSKAERTHPAPLPIFPLDRIYWDTPLAAKVHVHRAAPAHVASDHLPIVATLSV